MRHATGHDLTRARAGPAPHVPAHGLRSSYRDIRGKQTVMNQLLDTRSLILHLIFYKHVLIIYFGHAWNHLLLILSQVTASIQYCINRWSLMYNLLKTVHLMSKFILKIKKNVVYWATIKTIFSCLVWYSKIFRSDSVNYSKVEDLDVRCECKNELLISFNIDKTAKLKNLNNVEVKAQRPLVIYTKWRQLEFIQEAFETLNSMTDIVSWKSPRRVGGWGV